MKKTLFTLLFAFSLTFSFGQYIALVPDNGVIYELDNVNLYDDGTRLNYPHPTISGTAAYAFSMDLTPAGGNTNSDASFDVFFGHTQKHEADVSTDNTEGVIVALPILQLVPKSSNPNGGLNGFITVRFYYDKDVVEHSREDLGQDLSDGNFPNGNYKYSPDLWASFVTSPDGEVRRTSTDGLKYFISFPEVVDSGFDQDGVTFVDLKVTPEDFQTVAETPDIFANDNEDRPSIIPKYTISPVVKAVASSKFYTPPTPGTIRYNATTGKLQGFTGNKGWVDFH